MKKEQIIMIVVVAVIAAWFILPKLGIVLPAIPGITGREGGSDQMQFRAYDANGNLIQGVPVSVGRGFTLITVNSMQYQGVATFAVDCGAKNAGTALDVDSVLTSVSPTEYATAMSAKIGTHLTLPKGGSSYLLWQGNTMTALAFEAKAQPVSFKCNIDGTYQYGTPPTSHAIAQQIGQLDINFAPDPTGSFTAQVVFRSS